MTMPIVDSDLEQQQRQRIGRRIIRAEEESRRIKAIEDRDSARIEMITREKTRILRAKEDREKLLHEYKVKLELSVTIQEREESVRLSEIDQELSQYRAKIEELDYELVKKQKRDEDYIIHQRLQKAKELALLEELQKAKELALLEELQKAKESALLEELQKAKELALLEELQKAKELELEQVLKAEKKLIIEKKLIQDLELKREKEEKEKLRAQVQRGFDLRREIKYKLSTRLNMEIEKTIHKMKQAGNNNIRHNNTMLNLFRIVAGLFIIMCLL